MQRQKYWISTDTHLGHDQIIKFCSRPENFEKRIIRNHLFMINSNDIFLHLGDYCFGADAMWHHSLLSFLKPNVKKWLIRGNHDKQTISWYYKHGWDVVVDAMELNIYGKKILFTHRPVIIDRHDYNIHGHIHNTSHRCLDKRLRTDKHKAIMMEHDYKPQLLNEIIGL